MTFLPNDVPVTEKATKRRGTTCRKGYATVVLLEGNRTTGKPKTFRKFDWDRFELDDVIHDEKGRGRLKFEKNTVWVVYQGSNLTDMEKFQEAKKHLTRWWQADRETGITSEAKIQRGAVELSEVMNQFQNLCLAEKPRSHANDSDKVQFASKRVTFLDEQQPTALVRHEVDHRGKLVDAGKRVSIMSDITQPHL